MTALELAPATCPPRCEETKCRGEHWAPINDPMPATAGLPRASRYGGYWFPHLQFSLGWDTIDNLHPCVSLHVNGESVDTQADLRLHEAKVLATALQKAIEVLEERGRA